MLHRLLLATATPLAIVNPFVVMRLLAWIIFVVGPIGLVLLAWLRRDSRAIACLSWASAAALVVVGSYSFFVEPRWLEITRLEHRISSLERPLRVALVADIQVDEPGAFEESVLRRTLGLRPDLVLLAGDLIQARGRQANLDGLEALAQMLRQLDMAAPLGVFAVRGNIDSPGIWQNAFIGTKVIAVERTTGFDLGPVVLTCLSLQDSFNPGLELGAAERPQIVVGHAPDYALSYPPAELLLAGHTHGGQVRLPGIGPLITLSAVPRRWADRATQTTPETMLVVSRGVGMERGAAPRLRFLCRPQIVIIDLTPAPTPAGAPGESGAGPRRSRRAAP